MLSTAPEVLGGAKVASFEVYQGEIEAGTEGPGGANLSYLLALHYKSEGHFLPLQP